MTARSVLPALILGLAACGPGAEQTPASGTRADAPAPVPVQTGSDPCRALTEWRERGIEEIGTVGAYRISGTVPGVACSEPALERVDCSVRGPAEVHVEGPRRAGFAVDAGQSATFAVGPEGPRCFLHVSGD